MSEVWTFPWEQEARLGADMPDGLCLPDQMAYSALRSIYRDFHRKDMSREQASREKRLLRREWEKAKEEEASSARLASFRSRILRDTEAVKIAVRKDPIPENALRLCDVLDGLIERKTDRCRTDHDGMAEALLMAEYAKRRM